MIGCASPLLSPSFPDTYLISKRGLIPLPLVFRLSSMANLIRGWDRLGPEVRNDEIHRHKKEKTMTTPAPKAKVRKSPHRAIITAEQVSEYIHGLLHEIDPSNHAWTRLFKGRHEVLGLEVYPKAPEHRLTAAGKLLDLSPVVGFYRTFCEVSFIATDPHNGTTFWLNEPVGHFDYFDNDLLANVFRCLRDQGLKVSARVLTLAKRQSQSLLA